jgi:hypothetical protein
MKLNATEVLAKISKLVFGEQTEQGSQEAAAEETKVEEATETKVEETTEAPAEETKVEDEAGKQEFAAPSIEDQIASMKKQMEVLSEFANLKSQVDYLSQWVKDQVTVNAAYKDAFKELLPLVEQIASEPTADSAQTPKNKFQFSRTDEATKEARYKNFASAASQYRKEKSQTK